MHEDRDGSPAHYQGVMIEEGLVKVFYRVECGVPYKCHVITEIDDDRVAYKWYGKHKQWWHYGVMSKREVSWMLEHYDKCGWREG